MAFSLVQGSMTALLPDESVYTQSASANCWEETLWTILSWG